MLTKEYIIRRMVDPYGLYTPWGCSIRDAYKRVAKYSKFPIIQFSRRSRYIVVGCKIYNQLDHDFLTKTHLVMTCRDIFRCNKIPRSFTYDIESYRAVYDMIYFNKSTFLNYLEQRTYKLIKKTKAETLIANSTIDPINRIYINVGKQLGLNICCVQHGVYSNEIPKYVLEEDIIDNYFSLDSLQSNIICRNIPLSKIHNLGVEGNFTWIPNEKQSTICFVGEDWERYGLIDVKRMIISTYIRIICFLSCHGYSKFYYKPHPSEKDTMDIFSYATKLKSNEINHPDVFVGFGSTFLKDMSTLNKLSIQIRDDRTSTLNFSEAGYCLTLENDDLLYTNLLETISKKNVVPHIKEANLSKELRKLYE